MIVDANEVELKPPEPPAEEKPRPFEFRRHDIRVKEWTEPKPADGLDLVVWRRERRREHDTRCGRESK